MGLRAVRRAKDITQQQLADIARVDVTTISDIERGKNKNPSYATVVRIARALGVAPGELFPIEDEAAGDDEAPPAETCPSSCVTQ